MFVPFQCLVERVCAFGLYSNDSSLLPFAALSFNTGHDSIEQPASTTAADDPIWGSVFTHLLELFAHFVDDALVAFPDIGVVEWIHIEWFFALLPRQGHQDVIDICRGFGNVGAVLHDSFGASGVQLLDHVLLGAQRDHNGGWSLDEVRGIDTTQSGISA